MQVPTVRVDRLLQTTWHKSVTTQTPPEPAKTVSLVFEAYPYNRHILVRFGGPLQDAVDWYCKECRLDGPTPTEAEGSSVAVTIKRGACPDILIWFKNTAPPPSVVAHEAFHATAGIMIDLGARLSASTAEPWAYLLEHIVHRISTHVP